MTWDDNIEKSVAKARGCIAWVKRNVISRDINVMKNIYVSLIRPHLEYCVQLWSPAPRYGNWNIIDSIEDIQRTYTRLIDGIGLMTYKDRLNQLNLTTLLERRARGDIIEAYRIISGIANYGNNLFRMSRSGMNILIDGCFKTNSNASYFFSRRVAGYWNKIPAHVKTAPSVNIFKNRLENFKKCHFEDRGNYWELSDIIFDRTNDSSRGDYVDFMRENTHIAKRRGINTHM